MIIRGTTLDAVEAAAREVGVDVDATVRGPSRGGGYTISVKVNLTDGPTRERYRKLKNGRRVSAVCWHGFRDFFRALFRLTPNAIARTALAVYDGADGFEATYKATGWNNEGSQAFPISSAQCCDCGEGAR